MNWVWNHPHHRPSCRYLGALLAFDLKSPDSDIYDVLKLAHWNDLDCRWELQDGGWIEPGEPGLVGWVELVLPTGIKISTPYWPKVGP